MHIAHDGTISQVIDFLCAHFRRQCAAKGSCNLHQVATRFMQVVAARCFVACVSTYMQFSDCHYYDSCAMTVSRVLSGNRTSSLLSPFKNSGKTSVWKTLSHVCTKPLNRHRQGRQRLSRGLQHGQVRSQNRQCMPAASGDVVPGSTEAHHGALPPASFEAGGLNFTVGV